MEFGSSRLNILLTFLCAFSLLVNTSLAESTDIKDDQLENTGGNEYETESIRRQDTGFDLMSYLIGNRQQPQQQNQQQQVSNGQQQLQQAPSQQHLSVQQQQYQLQQQQLALQQLQEQQRLQQLQRQQLLQLQQQQQQQAPRTNDVYQDNTVQQQQQAAALNRDGGYGSIGIGGGYREPAKSVGISIGGGGGKPGTVQLGNILTLLPRIFNVLSAGGKVMFGAELGNNFYFGPVGVKPLYSG